MAWDFLRRFVQIVRSKMLAKLAPKLFKLPFTQLSFLEPQKTHWKLINLITKSPSEELIRSVLMRIACQCWGLSSLRLEPARDRSNEVCIMEVHERHEIWMSATISSILESSGDISFVEMQIYGYTVIEVSSLMFEFLWQVIEG